LLGGPTGYDCTDRCISCLTGCMGGVLPTQIGVVKGRGTGRPAGMETTLMGLLAQLSPGHADPGRRGGHANPEHGHPAVLRTVRTTGDKSVGDQRFRFYPCAFDPESYVGIPATVRRGVDRAAELSTDPGGRVDAVSWRA